MFLISRPKNMWPDQRSECQFVDLVMFLISRPKNMRPDQRSEMLILWFRHVSDIKIQEYAAGPKI